MSISTASYVVSITNYLSLIQINTKLFDPTIYHNYFTILNIHGITFVNQIIRYESLRETRESERPLLGKEAGRGETVREPGVSKPLNTL